MILTVSNTTPLHYLALIEEIHILPALYGHVVIPHRVFDELQQPRTPGVVKTFVASRPVWLDIRTISMPIPSTLAHLDRGEQEAITLALEVQADALLIDEAKGRDTAELHGLKIVGTLGILFDAAKIGLCELETVYEKLRQTNFRAGENLYQHFLKLHEKSQK
ncbi:MAG: DUF3368 domain-containing protein [Blastocatellia bacterium]